MHALTMEDCLDTIFREETKAFCLCTYAAPSSLPSCSKTSPCWSDCGGKFAATTNVFASRKPLLASF